MDFTSIDGFASKLERDEIFTFIFGFALGLLAFLVIFLDFPNQQDKLKSIKFISSDPYLLIFTFLGFGMFFTLLVNVVYNVVGFLFIKPSQKILKKRNERNTPNIYWAIDKEAIKQWAHVLHIYQLTIVALILLSLIFPFLIKTRHDLKLCSLYFLFYELILLTIIVVWIIDVRRQLTDLSEIYSIINFNKVKIFSDEKSYSNYQNKLVDNNFFTQQTILNRYGFKSLADGLRTYIW